MLDLQHKVQTVIVEDPRTKDYAIEVLDSNGVITLRGYVPSHQASNTVETVVRDVDGVVSVINELDVM
jgi:osmotically-inducible protein OsmY